MRIEILYAEGCPHHIPAVHKVQEALRQEGIVAEMIEVEVTHMDTSQAKGYLGSPTVRVEGLDVEVAARSLESPGMTCRTYVFASNRSGVPPLEWIRSAVREALLLEQRPT